MVRAEVELEGNGHILAGRKVGPHLRAAIHQHSLRVAFGAEIDAQLAGSELVRSAENGGEELLLESEPAQLRIHSLARAPSAAYLLGLLVALEVVVQLGVLALVLVAFLHSGHAHIEVKVNHIDIAGNERRHSAERKLVIEGITVPAEGVLLLDVASRAERQTEYHAAFILVGKLEVKVFGVQVLAGIDAERILGIAPAEQIKGIPAISLVLLQEGGMGLGSLSIELYSDFFVLKSDDAALSPVCPLDEGILIDCALERSGE